MKARAKAEKLERKAVEKAQRDLMKSEKEEGKRVRREEERARIERLAAHLKYRRQADAASTTSSGRRRQVSANQWIERSDGMYGDVNAWGGL